MIGIPPDQQIAIVRRGWRGQPSVKAVKAEAYKAVEAGADQGQASAHFLYVARTMLLYAHRQWVMSGGQVGSRLDLSGVDLRKVDLRNSALDEADLSGARLWHADLTGADLRGMKSDDAQMGKAPTRWRAESRKSAETMKLNFHYGE